MRYTPNIDSGIIICWFINMFLNWEIGALALLLWTASLWFNLSWYPAAVVAAVWVLGTLIFTLFFGWVISSRKTYRPNKDLTNVNPYSAGKDGRSVEEEKYAEDMDDEYYDIEEDEEDPHSDKKF